jgi:sugar lactone lactonase YvrE
MKNNRRAAVGIVAIVLSAGCAQSAPSTIVPSTGTNQARNVSQTENASSEAGAAKTGGRVLYIADIDGQPGVGQIHVYTASMHNPQPIRMITQGTGRPFGMWVDHKNVLYVANEANKYPASVTEFKPGASSPFFTITNFVGQPQSVAVDAQKNVFVNEASSDEGIVQEFAPGSNTAEKTIDTGVGGYAFEAGSMAFDPKGNLIVAEQAKLALHIVSIAKGTSTVTPLNLDLTNITGPGMGIDKAGNIYVASSQSASISVYPAGATEPSRTISNVPAYGLTYVTGDGTIYQASGEGTVSGVAPGANSPAFTLSCECSAQGVAVSR